jgi:ribosomal protein S18 acetylase RimI-like enzyme
MAHATDVPIEQIKDELAVERIEAFSDDDLHALCEATHAAIIEGGGFGWVRPPERRALESYFRGVLLVPERQVFVARLNETIVGSAQLVRPPRNNEAQAMTVQITTAFLAPWARGHKLARMLLEAAEVRALQDGFAVINIDVRETQTVAIALCETLGYTLWGTHPCYARVDGQFVPGRYYFKDLTST